MNETANPTQYETREETICWRYGKNREFQSSATYTVKVPVGSPEYKIPARNEAFVLDMGKVAEAQVWANKIASDLSE